ncbi:protein ALP1-like [Pecten maximus]|uniref:protein ALP1-like n=1 Tax=Pecten maximus TaxID=6579 RepID=UPI00145858B0|nr:protein ALP1-like [Pecten maximus]
MVTGPEKTRATLMDVPQNVDDFRSHFRISRNTFDIILQDIYHSLLLKGKGQHDTVSPDKQLAVCLWYLANQESMREVAHLFGLSKSTVHGIIMKVCNAFMDLGPRVIVWPSPVRQREIAHDVEEICKLPGVIGFLDGSHIRLASILNRDRDFYNRKGFPSMQLQV